MKSVCFTWNLSVRNFHKTSSAVILCNISSISTVLFSSMNKRQHLLYFLSAGISVRPCDFRFGLHLHDRRVLLGGSVWVPGRQQHYSHRHPGVPTGLQVEEAPCGQEDAGWVRQFLFFYSVLVCLFRQGWRSIHYSLLWNSRENICSSAAAGTDTFGLFM